MSKAPASVKVSTLGSTSTSHQHGPCPPPRLQCRGRDKVSLADAISAFGTWWRCFTMVVDDAASPCGMEVPRHRSLALASHSSFSTLKTGFRRPTISRRSDAHFNLSPSELTHPSSSHTKA